MKIVAYMVCGAFLLCGVALASPKTDEMSQTKTETMVQSAQPSGWISATDASKLVKEKNALLVDVRGAEEFKSGHIDGALNVAHDTIAANLEKFGSDKNREIVLYCKSGRRAGIARDELMKHGYTNVRNAGGYTDLAKIWSSDSKQTAQYDNKNLTR